MKSTVEHLRIGIAVLRLLYSVHRVDAPFYVAIGVAVPFFLYLVVAGRAAPDAELRVLLGCALFSALLLGIRIPTQRAVYERTLGQVALLSASGVARRSYLSARLVDAALLGLGGSSIVLVVAWALGFGPTPASGSWLAPLTCASLAFAGASLALSGVSSNPAATGLILNVVLGLGFAVCPLLYSAEKVPGILRSSIGVLPPSLAVEWLEHSWRGEPVPLHQPILLVVWAITLTWIGFRVAPWTEEFR